MGTLSRRALVVTLAVVAASAAAITLTTPASADSHDGELDGSAFARENDTFVGEYASFELDEDLPGIRNLTLRNGSVGVLDRVVLAGDGDVDWYAAGRTFSMAAGASTVDVRDRQPLLLQVESNEPVRLVLAPGLEARDDGAADVDGDGDDEPIYEVPLPGNRTHYVWGSDLEYEADEAVFTAREAWLGGPDPRREDPEETRSRFTRENDTFVGEHVSFTLDRDLPGVRDLTLRATGQVVFEEIRAGEGGQFDWSADFDLIHFSWGSEPSVVRIEDHDPPIVRVWVVGEDRFWELSPTTWELSPGDGVTVEREDRVDQNLYRYDVVYELGLEGNRRTQLLAEEPIYDASEEVFEGDFATVTQADRFTLEADEGDGCPGEPLCLRWRGTRGADPGDDIRIFFRNAGNSSHNLWVADRDDAWEERDDGATVRNGTRDAAIAGVEEVPPGETAWLNFTVPEEARDLYLWSDVADDEEGGMWTVWELQPGEADLGADPGAGSRVSGPGLGSLVAAVAAGAVVRRRR